MLWKVLGSVCVALLLQIAVHAVEIEITAEEHPYPASTTVVSAELPADVGVGYKSIRLIGPDNAALWAQRDSVQPSRILWLLESPLPAHETRRYRVVEFDASVPPPFVNCHKKDDDYVLSVQSKLVLLYNASLKECPVEGFSECRRSGFIHPIYAPDGTVVSDDFPPEHPHQHGIMFAWVHSTFRGREVDFWNSMKKLGITEHAKVLGCTSGPVFAELQVQIAHLALAPSGERQPALDETWRVRVFNSSDPFIVDIHSVQTCASDAPLELPVYHYGGMAFRGARPWSFGKATFLTSEGKDRAGGNHTRPAWTAITGQIDGRDYTFWGCGHPTNFRYPQPVRLHPDMPYFCWAPEVLGEFTITPGQPYESAYRFFVQAGKPEPARCDAIQQTVAVPLVGKVKR